ncbi:hypothetical protein ACFLWL_02325 [Chloroflexota bacterium]
MDFKVVQDSRLSSIIIAPFYSDLFITIIPRITIGTVRTAQAMSSTRVNGAGGITPVAVKIRAMIIRTLHELGIRLPKNIVIV